MAVYNLQDYSALISRIKAAGAGKEMCAPPKAVLSVIHNLAVMYKRMQCSFVFTILAGNAFVREYVIQKAAIIAPALPRR